MGSCVSSSHKKTSSSAPPDSNLAALISKPHPTSPFHNHRIITPINIHANARISSAAHPLSSPGDKEEEMVFFDSQCWLDSDFEDDFMSVDGEFTPSRETTPVHHKFCHHTPPREAEERTHEDEPSPSPTDNKKRLLELFKDTQADDVEEQQVDGVAQGKARACLWLRTPVRSSAPASPYNHRDRQQQRLKRVRSAAHRSCIPRLVSRTSFTERRRKMMMTH